MLVCSLVAALLVWSVPTPTSRAAAPTTDHESLQFRHGETLFRLDPGELESLWATLAERWGSHSVTLYAASPQHAAGTPGEGVMFNFAEPAALDELVQLELAASPGPGGNSANGTAAALWEEIVTWEVTSTALSVTSTLLVGADRVSTTVPWDLIDGWTEFPSQSAEVEVEVNGTVVRLDADSFERLRATVLDPGIDVQHSAVPGLALLAGSFDDLPRFANHVQGLFLAEARIRGEMAVTQTSDGPRKKKSCAPACLSCVGSLMLNIAAYLALIGSCGSALVSGGVTAIACMAAFIGLQGAHFAALGACGRCYLCATAEQ